MSLPPIFDRAPRARLKSERGEKSRLGAVFLSKVTRRQGRWTVSVIFSSTPQQPAPFCLSIAATPQCSNRQPRRPTAPPGLTCPPFARAALRRRRPWMRPGRAGAAQAARPAGRAGGTPGRRGETGKGSGERGKSARGEEARMSRKAERTPTRLE